MARARVFVRLLVLAALVAGMPSMSASSSVRVPAQPEVATEARIEVRIRKLHLARPDLLPYPLNFAVIC